MTIETLLEQLHEKQQNRVMPVTAVRMSRTCWEEIKPAVFHYQYTSDGETNTLLGVPIKFDEALPMGEFGFQYADPATARSAYDTDLEA